MTSLTAPREQGPKVPGRLCVGEAGLTQVILKPWVSLLPHSEMLRLLAKF
jgi:hypothetical protein